LKGSYKALRLGFGQTQRCGLPPLGGGGILGVARGAPNKPARKKGIAQGLLGRKTVGGSEGGPSGVLAAHRGKLRKGKRARPRGGKHKSLGKKTETQLISQLAVLLGKGCPDHSFLIEGERIKRQAYLGTIREILFRDKGRYKLTNTQEDSSRTKLGERKTGETRTVRSLGELPRPSSH